MPKLTSILFRCQETDIRRRYICDRDYRDNLDDHDYDLPSTDRDSVCFTEDQRLLIKKEQQRFANGGFPGNGDYIYGDNGLFENGGSPGDEGEVYIIDQPYLQLIDNSCDWEREDCSER